MEKSQIESQISYTQHMTTYYQCSLYGLLKIETTKPIQEITSKKIHNRMVAVTHKYPHKQLFPTIFSINQPSKPQQTTIYTLLYFIPILFWIMDRIQSLNTYHYSITNVQPNMESEFECTKIKDGLYLGTLATTQDYQFLQINKFSYVINCSAEIPNYFDSHGIKYLKFKLIKERTHKLWDQNLKKLRKLEKFIEEAEDLSLCCIVVSANGNNRSLVMLTAYLMSRYRWSLSKTLQYIRSKNVFIGLSQYYISQLELLENILNEEIGRQKLTNGWRGPYNNQQEELISRTFINSQEMPVQRGQQRPKKEKRVTWQDKIEKQKKKEIRDGKLRQTGLEQFKKNRSNFKFTEECNPHNSLSSKVLKKQIVESPLKKSQNQKKIKKQQKANRVQPQRGNELNCQFQQPSLQMETGNTQPKGENGNYFSQKQLIKLIKKNLKIKKDDDNKEEETQGNNQKQNNNEKGIYRLTINNYIQPNINIVNAPQDKNIDKNIKNNNCKNKNGYDKNRAQSQKEPAKINNDTNKTRPETNKSFKKNIETSPKSKEKKLQKAVSLQFKKNN